MSALNEWWYKALRAFDVLVDPVEDTSSTLHIWMVKSRERQHELRSKFSRSRRKEVLHLVGTGWQQTRKWGQRRQQGCMLGHQPSSI